MGKENLIDYDLYEIREDGTIISKLLGRPMKLHLTVNGYVLNTLKRKDGKPGKYYRHRVIWHYFNGDIPENKQIDHIDGNKLNNSITNLRCVSPVDNIRNPNTYHQLIMALKSEERRKKISESNTGRVVSEEQKRKQSFAMKGKYFGIKRPKHSEIMKRKERDNFGRWTKKR